jgi:ketosteroid isomerase-like protein
MKDTGANPDASLFMAVLHGSADPDLITAEARLRRAQLDADVGALDELISESLLFAGPDGSLASKAQDLEAHASGVVRFRRHDPLELTIRRLSGDIAVASLLAKLAVEVNGTTASGTYRYTRVWQHDADRGWRVVAGQVSEVRSTQATSSSAPPDAGAPARAQDGSR